MAAFVCCLASCLVVLGFRVLCGFVVAGCLIALLMLFVNSVVVVILLMFSLD